MFVSKLATLIRGTFLTGAILPALNANAIKPPIGSLQPVIMGHEGRTLSHASCS